ncbi:F-box domain-containing protein [Aphelenchoides besseyi]|nr:F-box domain-containing protein [Aphelenchoides besseyi]
MTLVDKYKDEEILLRKGYAERIPIPELPVSPIPELKSDFLCTSVSGLSLSNKCDNQLNSISRSSCPPILKFERKSPTVADLSLNGRDPFANLPWNVMYEIFKTFDLKERLKASHVCHRWYQLLRDGRFPLPDCVGINLFESEVWEMKISKNIQTAGKVECLQLYEFDFLDTIFEHCNSPGVVIKVWYLSLEFLERVLQKITEKNLRITTMDLFPYSHYLGTSLVYEYLPNLKTLTTRPHSSDHFFTGISIDHFPKFENLDSLNVDNFNFVEGSAFPQNLRNLDWQSRNDSVLDSFIEQIQTLRRLECLSVGNATFSGTSFLNFIQNISYWNMPVLQYLHLKLVKFNVHQALNLDFSTLKILRSLKVLRLELCYGLIQLITELFLGLTGPNFRILSVALLTDQKEFLIGDFFKMASILAKRDVKVHLTVMEPKDPPRKEQSEIRPEADVIQHVACNSIFADLLTKFEASFVTDLSLLHAIFAAPLYANLTEIKFIQCPSVDDAILSKIAISCPSLTRLLILSCHDVSKVGLRHFVDTFHSRRSEQLRIVWHRDRNPATSFITDFFLSLTNESSCISEGLSVRCYRKQFRSRFGELVVVWSGTKMLKIQDYDTFEQSRVLGCVLPSVMEQGSEATSL